MTSHCAPFILGEPVMTGSELRHLRGHKRLRKLEIAGRPIPGEFYSVPTLLKLEELYCSPKEGDKEAMVHIGKCQVLRKLDFYYGNVSDDTLEPLRELEKLEYLSLSGNPVSSGVRVVRHLKNLRSLILERTQVDDHALEVFRELPKLGELFIGSPNVTDSGVAHLAECSSLHTLSIASPRVTCRGVETLTALGNLKTLYFSETVPDLALLKALAKLPNLTRIDCNAKGITFENQIELSAFIPRCEIS